MLLELEGDDDESMKYPLPWAELELLLTVELLLLSLMADLLESDFALAEKNTLYRCLDRLVEHKDELFKFLLRRWGELFGARFDVLLYDRSSRQARLTEAGAELLREGARLLEQGARWSWRPTTDVVETLRAVKGTDGVADIARLWLVVGAP